MSKIAISGASTGSATFTIESPATSTNRTLTLPDNTGTIITQNSTPAFASTIGVGGATAAASGAGITFPATQSASSNANTLDDYEEGTFTPTIIGTSSAGTATYSAQNAEYTKVGNLVHFQINIAWSSGTGTGDLRIKGLPFTVKNNNIFPGVSLGYFQNVTLTSNTTILSLLASNNNEIYFYQVPSGGGGNLGVSYDAAGQIIVAGCYVV